jgi:hypothetical protein
MPLLLLLFLLSPVFFVSLPSCVFPETERKKETKEEEIFSVSVPLARLVNLLSTHSVLRFGTPAAEKSFLKLMGSRQIAACLETKVAKHETTRSGICSVVERSLKVIKL